VTDPSGAVWLYGYTPPVIPSLCVPGQFVVNCTPAQLSQSGTAQLIQSGIGLLQTVTIPKSGIAAYAIHGIILYSYGEQDLGGSKFLPGTGPAQLTGYAAITGANPLQFEGDKPLPQTNVTEAVLGLFGYANAPGSNTPTTGQPIANLRYPYNPIWQEDLSYGANQSVLGEASQVEFFKGKQNRWQWQLGYDSMGRVNSWTTNQTQNTSAATNVDNYAWTYDEVGNRTSETYNGTTTSYWYNYASDKAGSPKLDQLASVTGISKSYPSRSSLRSILDVMARPFRTV
jgi:hypothetical protein